jgi:hypothetical protein
VARRVVARGGEAGHQVRKGVLDYVTWQLQANDLFFGQARYDLIVCNFLHVCGRLTWR